MEYPPLKDEEEEIGKAIVNASFKVHKELGPGLLEKVYEVCMAHELSKAGFLVQRQIDIPIVYDGIIFDEGLRLDLLVNNLVYCRTEGFRYGKSCLAGTSNQQSENDRP